MRPPRLLIFGFGRVARAHAGALRALGHSAWAAVSRNPANRAAAMEAGAVEAYPDLDAALGFDAQAILVCAPILDMPEAVLRACELGVPILAEKPVGLSENETLDVAGRARAAAVPVMVAKNRRFYTGVERLRHAAGRDMIGLRIDAPDDLGRVAAMGLHPPRVLRSWMQANVVHALDLFRHIGGEVEWVESHTRPAAEGRQAAYFATLGYASGAIGQYTGAMASPGRWQVDLLTPDVRYRLDPLERLHVEERGKGVTVSEEPSPQATKPGFVAQMAHFLESVSAGVPEGFGRHSLEDHVHTVRLIEAIERPGRTVLG